jgi:hypothetical protein
MQQCWYQIFKDFAGPLATIFAALAAVGVTAYFAWHQKQIAKRQVDISGEKLRHNLYEKRAIAYSTRCKRERCTF